MFLKAMVVTDLYTASFPVEKCLSGLKELGIEDYYLLQCIEQTEMPGINLGVMKRFLQSGLDKHKQFLEKAGFNVEAEVVTGKAYEQINRLALEKKCSLIVLGIYKHTRACELLFGGSMASEEAYHQIMPILLIPIGPADKQRSFIGEEKYEFLNHVLFPTDFSKNAKHALLYLKEIIERGPKRVTLLHVQNKTLISPHLTHRLEEFNETDNMRLKKIKDEIMKKKKVEIDIEIRYGHPVREIIELTKFKQVSLIVMGSQGRGFLKEVFIGSISQNVARCSESPVLLIPVPERDRITTG